MVTAQRDGMPPGPAPKGGAKLTRPEMNARNAQIMKLFIGGHMPADIQRVVGGVSRQRIDQIIRAEIARGARHRQLLADEALTVQSARLDVMLRACWSKALGGDLKAVEAARRVIEAQSRLVMGPRSLPDAMPATEEFDPDDPDDMDELAKYRRSLHRRRGD